MQGKDLEIEIGRGRERESESGRTEYVRTTIDDQQATSERCTIIVCSITNILLDYMNPVGCEL